MLALRNLENLIKIENDLKSQYETKLNTQAAEIAEGVKKIEELQNTISKQQESLLELSEASVDKKRIEQTNRELNNRADNLKEEVEAQKKRIKALQKDLAEERAELKNLKQFDPGKMKKNLAANKKKLAEKTASNDLLQKCLNKSKSENNNLQNEINELKAKLEELQPAEEVESEETTA